VAKHGELGELVVKPLFGFGAAGLVVGAEIMEAGWWMASGFQMTTTWSADSHERAHNQIHEVSPPLS
jgi:hypothetical protein